MPFSYFDSNGIPRTETGSVYGGDITLADTIPTINVKGIPVTTSADDKSFGDTLLDTLLLGPRLLINGVSRQIDGLSDPRLQGAIVMNPNDPRFVNTGGVIIPNNGVNGAGFLNQPVFGTVTGGQAVLGLAALLAVVFIAKASN